MAVSAKGKEYHLRNLDMSDREVLALLNEAADNDGWAETHEIASNLWPKAMASSNGKAASAVAAISRRLAWMVRYGVVIRGPNRSGHATWALTEDGYELLAGRLNKSVETLLGKLTDAQAVLLTQELSVRDDDDLYFTLRRRAWQHGMGR